LSNTIFARGHTRQLRASGFSLLSAFGFESAVELGIARVFPYRLAVILRFLGLLNAAVWLGAVVFLTFGVGPVLFSAEMERLLGAKNFPYFSGAIAHLVLVRGVYLQFACGLFALLHLLAEWLYFGRAPKRRWLGVLIGLITLSLLNGCWIEPELKRLRAVQASTVAPPPASGHALETWQRAASVADLLTIAGLILYLWRVANPSDPTRVLPAAKFRS
jgi:hypothetical protein